MVVGEGSCGIVIAAAVVGSGRLVSSTDMMTTATARKREKLGREKADELQIPWDLCRAP